MKFFRSVQPVRCCKQGLNKLHPMDFFPWLRLTLLVLAFICPLCAHAQLSARKVVLAGENPQVQNRLRALDRQLNPFDRPEEIARWIGLTAHTSVHGLTGLAVETSSLEKWEQLLDDYEQLLNEGGEALVPLQPTDPQVAFAPPSIHVRRLCHMRIAALPPSILQEYRRRVDARAQKLFQEGLEDRVAQPLRRLVDEHFCSSFGDRALDLLGDLAFEKGDFEEALSWWRVLAPCPTEMALTRRACLIYPDSRIELARIQAKHILALAFDGDFERARKELKAFRSLHPSAKGTLAGTEGPYAEILGGWIRKRLVHSAASNQEPWTTFAGNPARNHAPAVCPSSRLWIDGPTWRVRLPHHDLHRDKVGGNDLAPLTGPAGKLAFHPLIVGDRVLVADARSVLGYQLRSGKQLFRFDLKVADFGEKNGLEQVEGRFTLTATDNLVFARLGRQAIGPNKDNDRAQADSYLVCLEIAGPKPGTLQWQIPARTAGGQPALFEGTPLVHEGRVFCAVSRILADRTHTALACYDAQTGKRRWWQEVCDTPEFEDHREPRQRHHLLTLAAGGLYYCSHSGAVVCVDPHSGRHLWAMRYPSRGSHSPEGIPSPRDLAPAVYAAGKLYLAPLDAAGVFCLDAASGQLLWHRETIEIVHLLGVSRGRVYCTTPHGMRALNVADGSDQGGWLQPADGKLPGLGRGLLAGSWLFWPTQDPRFPYRGLTLDEGVQERFSVSKEGPAEPEFLEPTMLRTLVPGNMAFGEGCLAIAGLDELAVYVPQMHFLKERQETLKDAKATPLQIYRLAQAQADAGFLDEAERSFAKLEKIDLSEPLEDRWKWMVLAHTRRLQLRDRLKNIYKVPYLNFPLKPPSIDVSFPETAPKTPLSVPLELYWEAPDKGLVRLSRFPDNYDADRILLRGPRSDFCVSLKSRELLWKVPAVGFFENHSWAGGFSNLIVAAHSEGIQAFDWKDGKHRWLYSEPHAPIFQAEVLPHWCLESKDFSTFQFNDRLLLLVVEKRLVLALDPLTGHLAWSFHAPGAELRPLFDGGRFYPHYRVGNRFTLLQTISGKVLVLDSKTGKLLHETATSTQPWPHPPLALDDSRFGIGEDGGRAVLFDAAAGKTLWTFAPPYPTSLSGAPASVFGDIPSRLQGAARARNKTSNEVLLALVPRNLGPDVVRLDPDKGTPLWTVPFLPDLFDVQTASFDRDAVYFACNNTLQARALKDGKLLWQKPLPGNFPNWQTVRILDEPRVSATGARTGDALIVYPKETLRLPWLPIQPYPVTWPLVHWLSKPPRQERSILAFDPKDGRLIQRLSLTDAGPINVQILPGHLVAGGGGKVWVFRSAAGK